MRLRDEMFRDYPAAALRLAQNLHGLKLTYQLTLTPEDAQQREIHYRSCCNTECFRFDHDRGDREVSQVATPEKRFTLKRSSEYKTWKLSHLNRRSYQEQLTRILAYAALPSGMFCLYEVRICDFVDEEYFEVINCWETVSDDYQRVYIEWNCPFVDENGNRISRLGSFCFLPELDWALSEYTFGSSRKQYLQGQIDYKPLKENNRAIPVCFRLWSIDREHKSLKEKIELIEISTINESENLFELAHFGIPNNTESDGLGDEFEDEVCIL